MASPRRIIIYNHHFFPSVGGTEASGRIMARELAAIGFDVTVYTTTKLPELHCELDEGFGIVRSESLFALAKLTRRSDILICRGGISLRALLAAHLTRTSLIAIHESDDDQGTSRGGVLKSLKQLMKRKLRRLVGQHVAVSDALRTKLSSQPIGEVITLHNPVSQDLWTTNPASWHSRDIDVLFVGRLIAEKGIFVLRDALKQVEVQSGNLKVVIAGSSTDDALIKAHFSCLGGDVVFVGSVGGEVLRDLYSRAKTVVLPSTVYEGMGMVAAEAIASGTPVCASDQAALREVVDGAGIFHPMGDAAVLAASISNMIFNLELWNSLSDRAVEHRKAFSMAHYRSGLKTIINEFGSA